MKRKILLPFLIIMAVLIISNISYAGEGFRIVNQQSVLNPIVYGFPWDDPAQSAPGSYQAKGTEPWVAPPNQNTKNDIWTKAKFFIIARCYLFSNGILNWIIDEESVKEMVIIH